MKLAGLLLLISGWLLTLAALPLLSRIDLQAAFVLAGVGVEALGMVLLVRSHIPSGDGQENRGKGR